MEGVASPQNAFDGSSDDGLVAFLLHSATRANWILISLEVLLLLTSIYIYGIVVNLFGFCILSPF
jgi:hypothetical protein